MVSRYDPDCAMMDHLMVFFDRLSFVEDTALPSAKALMPCLQTKAGRELLANGTNWTVMGRSSINDVPVGVLPLFFDRLRAEHEIGGVMEGKVLSLTMSPKMQIQSNSDGELLTTSWPALRLSNLECTLMDYLTLIFDGLSATRGDGGFAEGKVSLSATALRA